MTNKNSKILLRGYLFLLLNLFLGMEFSNAQNFNIPMNQYLHNKLEAESIYYEQQLNTGFKPFLQSDFQTITFSDSILYRKICPQTPNFLQKTWIWRKMRNENLLEKNGDNYAIMINPLGNIEFNDNSNGAYPLGQNTRGLEAKGNLGQNFSFYTSLYENQTFYPQYVRNKIEAIAVVPGQAAAKHYKTTGYDYAYIHAYISFKATNFLNLQIGHDKHFVGHGYRSLLLSDNSTPYPFVQMRWRYKNFQYISMFTQMMGFDTDYWNFGSAVLAYHYRKPTSMNYLSYTLHNKLEISLFESVMFNTTDGKTYSEKIPISFFNPIIFSRLPQYKLNNKNNILLGANLKINVLRNFQFYAQVMLDNIDFEANKLGKNYFQTKTGYQLGAKIFDVFFQNFDKANFYIQAELNKVRPFAYAHENKISAYTNMNLPLAHPLGANFEEKIVITRFSFHDFFMEAILNQTNTTLQTNENNWGRNPLISDLYASIPTNSYNVTIGMDTPLKIQYTNFKIGFILNPVSNANIFVGYVSRTEEMESLKNEFSQIYFGIATNLNNYYFDF